MKVQALLLLLVLVPAVTAQNQTDQNETVGDTDLPGAVQEEAFDLRLAISAAAVVFLVVAFVYMAKR